MSDLKSRLPGKSDVDMNLDEFLSGAESKTTTIKKVSKPVVPMVYPWQEDWVREDVTKVYNLRLSEPYLLKLKYISDNTTNSMQAFCLKIVQKAIDDKIIELTK
jgi:hypothetical protein